MTTFVKGIFLKDNALMFIFNFLISARCHLIQINNTNLPTGSFDFKSCERLENLIRFFNKIVKTYFFPKQNKTQLFYYDTEISLNNNVLYNSCSKSTFLKY